MGASRTADNAKLTKDRWRSDKARAFGADIEGASRCYEARMTRWAPKASSALTFFLGAAAAENSSLSTCPTKAPLAAAANVLTLAIVPFDDLPLGSWRYRPGRRNAILPHSVSRISGVNSAVIRGHVGAENDRVKMLAGNAGHGADRCDRHTFASPVLPTTSLA